jgi:hypothetical protein
MRRPLWVAVSAVAVMAFSAAHAEEKANLGNFPVTLKIGFINFMDDAWEHGDVKYSFYPALEGYARIIRNLYIGGEFGYVNSEELVDAFLGMPIGHNRQLTFLPIELNLKYALEAAPGFFVDFGAGVSYSYASAQEELFLVTHYSVYDDSAWLFGGQFFVDLTYKVKRFLVGLNWKYQITESLDIDPMKSSELVGSLPPSLQQLVPKILGFDVLDRADYSNFRICGHIGVTF